VTKYNTFTLKDISGFGKPDDAKDVRGLGFDRAILFTCTAKPDSKDGSESASDTGRFFMVFESTLLSKIPRLTFYIGNHKGQGDAGTRWISGFLTNIGRVERGIIFIHVTVEELTRGFMAAMASMFTVVWHLGKLTMSLTSKGEPIAPLKDVEVRQLIVNINNILRGPVSQEAGSRRELTGNGKRLYREAIEYGNLELKKYIDARFKSGAWQNNAYIQVLRAFVLIEIMDTVKTNLLHNDIYNNPSKLLTNLNSAGILNSVYKRPEKVYEKLCNLDTSMFDYMIKPYYPGSEILGSSPIQAANASLPFFEEVIGMSSPTSNIAASYFALCVFSTTLDTGASKGSIRGATVPPRYRTIMIPESEALVYSQEAADPPIIQKSIIRDYIEDRKLGRTLSGKEYVWNQLIKFLKIGYDDVKVSEVPAGTDRSPRGVTGTEEEEAAGLPPGSSGSGTHVTKAPQDPSPPISRTGSAASSAASSVKSAAELGQPNLSGSKRGRQPPPDAYPADDEGDEDDEGKTPTLDPKKLRTKPPGVDPTKPMAEPPRGGTLKRSHQYADRQALADRRKRRTRRKRRHGEPKVTVEIVAL
jgi:hypothetical protein